MARHVALLRGVNVGGKNRLPMKALADVFTSLGAKRVTTYIQSGNVVFAAPAALAKKLPGLVEAALEKEVGVTSPILLVSADELERALATNPFAAEDPARLSITFLREAPTKERIAALDPNRSPPDRFAVDGRFFFLHTPNGIGKSKITSAWVDTKLATIGTNRNLDTVRALLDLARAP